MSWLITFAWDYSSCEERGLSENYKMKNSCPQWDSNPVPSAYEASALTIATRSDIYLALKRLARLSAVCYFNLPVARGRCSKNDLSCIFVILYLNRFAV